MLLSHLDAAVAEHHGNTVHRYSGLEQLDGERVSKAVSVAVWNPSPDFLPRVWKGGALAQPLQSLPVVPVFRDPRRLRP
jgi:hypothetical protein